MTGFMPGGVSARLQEKVRERGVTPWQCSKRALLGPGGRLLHVAQGLELAAVLGVELEALGYVE